jgi:hypothetical protein
VTSARSRRAQRIAARGDDPPVWITELGWATGDPPSAFRVSETRQARLVERTLMTLWGAARGLDSAASSTSNWKDSLPYLDGRDFFGLHTGSFGGMGARRASANPRATRSWARSGR